jgi:hypothetical protein
MHMDLYSNFCQVPPLRHSDVVSQNLGLDSVDDDNDNNTIAYLCTRRCTNHQRHLVIDEVVVARSVLV